jgi:hypothetical protein
VACAGRAVGLDAHTAKLWRLRSMMVRANYLNLGKMDFRASPFGFLSTF